MPKRRKDPKPPEAAETDEGVAVVFPGRILPPTLKPLRRARHCPSCGTGPVSHRQRYGVTELHYLYECPRCVDPETCRPTRWKDNRPR